MSLFSKRNTEVLNQNGSGNSDFAEMALKTIHEGVVVTNEKGMVLFVNPAAARMVNCVDVSNNLNMDYGLLIKIESKNGEELSDEENPLIKAMNSGVALENCIVNLVVKDMSKRIPVSISVLPMDGGNGKKIITFRDISKELEEDNAQSDFIYTASHEMRTPVASIEGFLALALNPQTATIDDRARGYLNTAHDASKHLGKLFQDLLDTTKLDDGRLKAHLIPVDLIKVTKEIADTFAVQIGKAKLNYIFGDNSAGFLGKVKMKQVAYASVDVDFLREALNNLIDNAIKYTPEGGVITINAIGEENRILISVSDTGPGISAEDLKHIFQKFYRSDNSQTRTVGGTGLGLYLVKQRIDSMGGKVWAESMFGQGSTFYISLPRLSDAEYNKLVIAYQNEQLVTQPQALQPQNQMQELQIQPQLATLQPQPAQPQVTLPQVQQPQQPQQPQIMTQTAQQQPQPATLQPQPAQPQVTLPQVQQPRQPQQPQQPQIMTQTVQQQPQPATLQPQPMVIPQQIQTPSSPPQLQMIPQPQQLINNQNNNGGA